MIASGEVNKIVSVLARRLPSVPAAERQRLAEAYLAGAQTHAVERTIGTGSVPTGLGSERAELLACVCRALGRVLTEEEIGALLRVIPTTARSVQKTMLAAFDDLPLLIFKAAFDGAKRDGRGTQGDITDGYRVKFSKAEKMDMARMELATAHRQAVTSPFVAAEAGIIDDVILPEETRERLVAALRLWVT